MSSIVKKKHNRRLPFLIPALLLLMGSFSSCNSSSAPTEEIAVTVSTVAVKDFYLKADSKVMADLDSVFFSIDLKNGVIFNADSLPKGADITKLVPVITFANSMKEADLVMKGGTLKEGTVNYLENSTDSIDFSGDVKLNVTAFDGESKYTYTIKVNVHKQVPDSLMWDRMATTSLPSRLGAPVSQKTLERDGKVYSLIEEKDHTYTLSTAQSVADGSWNKSELSLSFEPDVRSFTSTPDSFWILSTDGTLYESADATAWSSTGEKWITLIGAYQESVLGIKDDGGKLMHCHYPASASIVDTEMESDFPLFARSPFRTIETLWAEEPTAFFVGGVTSTGERSNHTWAFDGTTWATIDATSTPALEGASLMRYVVYRETQSSFRKVAYDAWIVIGGILENGDFNRQLYVSFDNGVTWRAASDTMTPPSFFPDLSEADAIVIDSSLDADLADGWTEIDTKSYTRAVKPSYTLDGYDITWKCPYIYIFGGETTSGKLSDTVWRGVLARLAFTPII